jgi:hypothetical protein
MYESSVMSDRNYGTGGEALDGRDKGSLLLADIEAALKREQKWRKEASRCFKLYEGDKEGGDARRYNIFYSNTEIMHPALYNRTPRLIVERRYRTDDPIASKAAELAQRFLEFQLDNGQTGFAPTFDECAADCILDALVVGRGVARVKYHAEFEKISQASQPDGSVLEVAAEQDVKTDERVTCERVPWDWFCHGYAKSWSQVPWVAFMHRMTRQELVGKFGEGAAKEFVAGDPYSEPRQSPDSSTEGLTETRDVQPEGGLYDVWEVWERRSKKVYFVSRDCPHPLLLEYQNAASGLPRGCRSSTASFWTPSYPRTGWTRSGAWRRRRAAKKRPSRRCSYRTRYRKTAKQRRRNNALERLWRFRAALAPGVPGGDGRDHQLDVLQPDHQRPRGGPLAVPDAGRAGEGHGELQRQFLPRHEPCEGNRPERRGSRHGRDERCLPVAHGEHV